MKITKIVVDKMFKVVYIENTMTKKKSITIRLNAENYDKLSAIAIADRRSKAMITEIAVEQYLNRRKAI